MDPAELVTELATKNKNKIPYPTDENKIYPSNKDGTYGVVIQLTSGPNARFARHRGKEIYYFNIKGTEVKFENIMIPIANNRKKLPPDVHVIFKGPDGLYYFVRDVGFCRRPLNVSGVGLEPEDYCPVQTTGSSATLQDLYGCNIRTYPPEVQETICTNTNLENAFLDPIDLKTVWLFKGSKVWFLHNLPTNEKAMPTKGNVTYFGDVSSRWKGFIPNSDSMFTYAEDKSEPQLIQFHKHKFKIWKFSGGNPIHTDFIKEYPISENKWNSPKPGQAMTKTGQLLFVERMMEPKVETKRRPIVYKDKNFRRLCADPTIDSADTDLNGKEVTVFKGDMFYTLTGIKEKGIGTITKFGKAYTLYNPFRISSTAAMTCKEGRNRGFFYEFYTTGDKNNITGQNHTKFTSWNHDLRLINDDQEWVQQEAGRIDAVFHNRNITEPMIIALSGDQVFYYSTASDEFVKRRRPMKHSDCVEKLPPNVTAAFSLPNKTIYLFRDSHYCARDLYYDKLPLYCPKWGDSRELFGCYGEPPAESKNKKTVDKTNTKKPNNFEAMKDLCSNLDINDADKDLEREDTIYVWRGDKFWRVADFPDSPRVIEYGMIAKKWTNFSDNPDAVVIIQEGKLKRGHVFAMFGHYWSSWYPSSKPWVGYKQEWKEPTYSMRFEAMMHNGDIKNPTVLGFAGKYVYYYSSDGSLLNKTGERIGMVTLERWPLDITGAFRMDDSRVFLFSKDTYCQRTWNCVILHLCCKFQEWRLTRELFRCNTFKEYSFDSTPVQKTEDSKQPEVQIEPDNSQYTTTEQMAVPAANAGLRPITEDKDPPNLNPNQIMPTPRKRRRAKSKAKQSKRRLSDRPNRVKRVKKARRNLNRSRRLG